jgi:hypothetical protein
MTLSTLLTDVSGAMFSYNANKDATVPSDHQRIWTRQER